MSNIPFNAYLPIDRRRALAQEQPLPEHAHGCVLFADISGFTPLATTLVDSLGAKQGAEVLTQQTNRVYDALITEVHRFGGVVINFGGDGLTCWFVGDEGQRAMTCALAMQQAMTPLTAVTTPGGQRTLAIKITITAGPVRRMLVGDSSIRQIEVLTGQPVERGAAGDALAHQGDVLVGAEVVNRFADQITIREWRTHSQGLRFAVLSDLTPRATTAPQPPPVPIPANQARPWLLQPVFQRLQHGAGAFLTELRLAVPMFVAFNGIDYERDEATHQFDAYIRWVQSILHRYEGFLLEVITGDKGSHFYAVFGAPISHEDDPLRAVMAARELQTPPPHLDFIYNVRIGLSRGQVRCGEYGNEQRRTYGVNGNEVNLAARLMIQAEPREILVSDHIVRAVATVDVSFQFRQIVQLKGIDQGVPVHRVSTEQQRETAVFQPTATSRIPIIGRDSERNNVLTHLQTVYDTGESRVVFVEGEAGIGKTHFLVEISEQARNQNVRSLLGYASAIEQSTPFHAWRPIFIQLLQLAVKPSSSDNRERLLSLLAQDAADLTDVASLLNRVLPVRFPETEAVRQMTPEARASNTRDLLLALMETAVTAAPTPHLFMIDDAQWLDSASWQFARLVSQYAPGVLLLIAMRPRLDRANTDYNALATADDTFRLQLKTLSLPHVEELVCRQLKVHRLAPAIIRFIYEKAEGHPFFSEEIAYALRDTGLIQKQNGRYRLDASVQDLHDLDFPDTIEGVITSRIDLLTPQEQLALKVGSVIGRMFAYPTLRDIHPIPNEKPSLRTYLDSLEQLDIILQENPEPELAYVFKHLITQEVAYNLMTSGQKKTLHRRVANWYEDRHQDNLANYYPVLAHHWEGAGEIAKAVNYLDEAGQAALRSFANEEAVRFFSHALELSDKAALELPRRRRARWELQLGEAYVQLSRYVPGRAHLETGLALLGYPLPTEASAFRQTVLLLQQLVKQLGHRWLANRFLGAQSEQREALLPACRAYILLIEVYHYADEQLLATYVALRGLNLAELAGLSPELAQVYGPVGFAFSLIPWRSAAQAYLQRSLETAVAVNSLSARLYALMVSGYYYGGQANWVAADSAFSDLIARAQAVGDKRRWQDGLIGYGHTLYLRGRFNDYLQLIEQPDVRELQHNAPSFQASMQLVKAEICFYRGCLAAAEEALTMAETALRENEDVANELLRLKIHALRSRLQWRQQAPQEALATLAHAEAILKGIMAPDNFTALPGYTAPADLYLALWEAQVDVPNLAERTREACRRVTRFARVLTVMAPHAGRATGLLAWLSGKKGKAHRHWRDALRKAERLQMPYHAGLLHYEIGRHLPPDSTKRQVHLHQARATFARLGVEPDRQQAANREP